MPSSGHEEEDRDGRPDGRGDRCQRADRREDVERPPVQLDGQRLRWRGRGNLIKRIEPARGGGCLLYTSPSPRDS